MATTRQEILFERLLDLTERIRLEGDPNKMIALTTELNKVLIETLDVQAQDRSRKTPNL